MLARKWARTFGSIQRKPLPSKVSPNRSHVCSKSSISKSHVVWSIPRPSTYFFFKSSTASPLVHGMRRVALPPALPRLHSNCTKATLTKKIHSPANLSRISPPTCPTLPSNQSCTPQRRSSAPSSHAMKSSLVRRKILLPKSICCSLSRSLSTVPPSLKFKTHPTRSRLNLLSLKMAFSSRLQNASGNFTSLRKSPPLKKTKVDYASMWPSQRKPLPFLPLAKRPILRSTFSLATIACSNSAIGSPSCLMSIFLFQISTTFAIPVSMKHLCLSSARAK
mmetsp:Transcript_10298/g.15522  ORF Transcript_10298/g.15522 Transcript_10298/m.15522 type:complete len:278 (-) Transcript_10298:385-1218(-)